MWSLSVIRALFFVFLVCRRNNRQSNLQPWRLRNIIGPLMRFTACAEWLCTEWLAELRQTALSSECEEFRSRWMTKTHNSHLWMSWKTEGLCHWSTSSDHKQLRFRCTRFPLSRWWPRTGPRRLSPAARFELFRNLEKKIIRRSCSQHSASLWTYFLQCIFIGSCFIFNVVTIVWKIYHRHRQYITSAVCFETQVSNIGSHPRTSCCSDCSATNEK